MKNLTCTQCGNTLAANLFEEGICIGCITQNRRKAEEKQDEKTIKGILVLMGLGILGGIALFVLIILSLIKYVF